ncbi:uncharacterized protein LOC132262788 isoform X2 [Phlebotomus argentipes]|uniref:uncharacterized protein LOC132262788 isoform X2 n=1 Tax=Phlebotomus argentipes TaxID=94469 RepID=UPI0028937044|nr:uncharacterized protein LOC132262788 isoform X2 [Phlebotomus argentipes]
MIESEELEVLCDIQIDDIFRDDDIPSIGGVTEQEIESETQPDPTPVISLDTAPVMVEIPAPSECEQTSSILELPQSVLSPAESASSASSDSWSTTSTSTDHISKRTKRKCIPCNLTFKHHYDFFEHHRKHVSMPILKLKQLTQREIQFQEFMKKGKQQFLCARKKTFPNIVLKKPEGDGLKLKFKFHNVQMNHDEDQRLNGIRDEFRRTIAAERRGEKILKASEIKQSPPGSPGLQNRGIRELIPIPELPVEMMSPEKIHFECPTLDGLDQFNSESREDASDILKNLLELNQQPLMEPEWNGPNEFISIDKLGHICRVCHMNFTDPVLLFQHQRQSGHDMPPQGPPMPPQSFPMSQHPPMPRMPANHMHYRSPEPIGNFPGQRIRDIHPQVSPGSQMAALRLQQIRNGQFRPVMPVQPPFMRGRHPPPLYRVGGAQGVPPMANMGSRQQLLQQPPMLNGPQGPQGYRFAVSNGMMMNGGIVMEQNYNQGQQMLQDSQLQAPMHGMGPMFRGARPNLPPRRHSVAPIPIRPNLSQFQQPPAKKPRQELMGDAPMVTMPPRAEGVPVIESVQSGSAVALPQAECSKTSPVPSGQKSPKAVASILANRGITVTQSDFSKTKESAANDKSPDSVKDKLADETESVVQKLALNSSVSIISKKKTPLLTIDVTEEEMSSAKPAASSPSTENRPKTADLIPAKPGVKPRHTTFLSCPDVRCQKKFLTEEALQRHTQKGHHSNIRFKCTKCSVMFSSSESLIIHQRRVHRSVRMPGEDLGIPIVDLNSAQTRMKLLSMGIKNFIPLGNINKVSNGFFGLPLVTLKGAPNAAISNLQNIGADSVLSLGPIKPIMPK